MQHADGDAPVEGARQPDLDDGEEVKYIKHGVSVFVDDRSSVPPSLRARARARACVGVRACAHLAPPPRTRGRGRSCERRYTPCVLPVVVQRRC